MTTLQNRYQAHKDDLKAKQETEAQKQIEAQRKKDQLAILEAPVNKIRITQLAERTEKQRIAAEKKENARLEKIDCILSEIFNRISQDDDITFTALTKHDGKITQSVGGINTAGQYFKTGLCFLTKSVGVLSPENIEQNKAYQAYKDKLNQQGFDVEITDTSDSGNQLGATKIFSGGCTLLGAAAATVFFPAVVIGGVGLMGVWASTDLTANFTLQVTERPPLLALEDKTKQQAEASELMAELNTQPIKAAVKQPIIR